jgi:DEAD/DEAH box helicase domain-containing protein
MLDTTFSINHSWYKSYFVKTFQSASNHAPIINDFYAQILEALVDIGILNKITGLNNTSYAINPSALIVENLVKAHECVNCLTSIYVAESDLITQRTRCLDYTCNSGVYNALPKQKPNYYQLVYNRNRSPRIYAAEHTGILERKDRENKEIDFKERPNFNSLNTIVATSTLEMGIDIGSLNTAINNSVPPLTSNFLQRVGRAGRSSGSALIANFAQSKPHDLFYFQEPSDMMEGEIATPACYLEAKDILFRHFFAFCLDKWSSANPANNSIPLKLFSLRLLTTDLRASDFFPNRIIT